MLFTDTQFISDTDLLSLDSYASIVAANNGINILGHLMIAQQEMGEMMLAATQSFADELFDDGTPGPSHSNDAPLQKIRLGQIVVDDTWTAFWSPIKRATAYLALMMIYRDASGRLKEDIYDKKRAQWEMAFQREWTFIQKQGIPVVANPIPAPAAVYEPNSGTWDTSNITPAAVDGTQGGNFDIAVSYMAAGVEGYRSAIASTTVGAGNVLSIDISTLIPPTGQQSFVTVDGWKLYVGQAGGTLYLQDQLPIATSQYQLPAGPVLSGVAVGRGQAKDTVLVMPPAISLYRG